MPSKSKETEERFKTLLRELFQSDKADLNFGIYRAMNQKHKQVEAFIDQQIVAAVDNCLAKKPSLDSGDGGDAQDILRKFIIGNFGKDAFDSKGNLLSDFRKVPLGKLWLAVEASMGKASPPSADLRDEVFNRLYEFFSRYYDEGDFVRKRRHAGSGRYAIPYNGEEVLLHWANRDQYYIKTTEHFSRYEFTLKQNITVRFEIDAAELSEDNNKAKAECFFIPLPKRLSATKRGKAQIFVLPFDYRPLKGDEEARFGGKNTQAGIIEDVWKTLKKNKAAAPLLVGDEEDTPMIERHIKRYVHRNTADYFIHKNLRQFFHDELDFYIKNELLNAADIVQMNGNTQARFAVATATRTAGLLIVDFLAQLEDFRKTVWEKKKFITATHYCIAVGQITDAKLRDKIVACTGQWQEWEGLRICPPRQESAALWSGAKLKEKRLDFLREHPTLPVDTVHFDKEFKEKVLASFDDLEEATDGVLFRGENWQALNLMQEKYRGRVQCIHIDPPYNTNTSGFLYKNDFLHSSWLAMMENRMVATLPLLADEGVFQCHIDENEYERLHSLCEGIFAYDAGTVIWNKGNPILRGSGIASQHEYILWHTQNKRNTFYFGNQNIKDMMEEAKSIIAKHGGVNDDSRQAFRRWATNNENLSPGERTYHFLDDEGRIYQGVSLASPGTDKEREEQFFVPLIHPTTKRPCPVPNRGWKYPPEKMQTLVAENKILFGQDETVQPRGKIILNEESQRQVSSVLMDGRRGITDIEKLGLHFAYCHPVSLYENIIGAGLQGDENSAIALDFFAGSGTTAHAVINLNRQDGRRRSFILAEMGEYFDTVLLPRIKKIIFTPEWKDSKPARPPTKQESERTPRIIKYHHFESYDDALENIVFQGNELAAALFENYTARYMLKEESRASATFCPNEKLETPLDFKLLRANGDVKIADADLPETFAYLVGLREKTRQTLSNGKRRYVVQRGDIGGRQTAVIWRNTANWTNEDYKKDREFIKSKRLTEHAEQVYINNDSMVKNAESLTTIFKIKMLPDSDEM